MDKKAFAILQCDYGFPFQASGKGMLFGLEGAVICGGLAQSELFIQTQADVLGLKVNELKLS